MRGVCGRGDRIERSRALIGTLGLTGTLGLAMPERDVTEPGRELLYSACPLDDDDDVDGRPVCLW